VSAFENLKRSPAWFAFMLLCTPLLVLALLGIGLYEALTMAAGRIRA
jgi:hypothetical protein